MIEKVREIVKREAEKGDWKYHIVIVVKYAKLLAKELGADQETTELAALLHDIGRIKFGPKDHEKTGVPEAEKILKKVGYSQDIIEEVKHCVESHRGSKNIPRETLVAKIIANADAMAHFDILPKLFFHNAPDEDFKGLVEWMYDKIERDWHNKLDISEAREMMKYKYGAIKLILNTMKDYL